MVWATVSTCLMHRNKLFNLSRQKLALLYAGVMGVILSVFGLTIYQVMAQVHWYALDRELESVAGTLHDALEPNLQQPGQIDSDAAAILPGLCRVDADCSSTLDGTERHVLGVVQRDTLYLRFVALSGQTIATLGYHPPGLPIDADTLWQTLEDEQGNRYHQMSLLLKTESGQPWGYMQVGRSLAEFDGDLGFLKWILFIGLPLALVLITLASWWLAGFAMRPIYRSYSHIQQFTADAAHELRTPLAAIRTTIESTLETPELTETESRNTLQIIERQNNRLAQLVQDLLLLSRMDIQELKPKQRACCLNDLVSDTVEELEGLAFASGITLSTKIQTMQPLYVSGNEEQLYRLLANLVTNAIRYTPQGGRVTVSLERSDHHVLIHVQDTGIGIAKADQARIFDRFYRVNTDRSRATGGSGLGLSIAQAIAQAHEGSIQVWSELGEGSRFTVHLPISKKSTTDH
jgi:signal transduction histidine kinase